MKIEKDYKSKKGIEVLQEIAKSMGVSYDSVLDGDLADLSKRPYYRTESGILPKVYAFSSGKEELSLPDVEIFVHALFNVDYRKNMVCVHMGDKWHLISSKKELEEKYYDLIKNKVLSTHKKRDVRTWFRLCVFERKGLGLVARTDVSLYCEFVLENYFRFLASKMAKDSFANNLFGYRSRLQLSYAYSLLALAGAKEKPDRLKDTGFVVSPVTLSVRNMYSSILKLASDYDKIKGNMVLNFRFVEGIQVNAEVLTVKVSEKEGLLGILRKTSEVVSTLYSSAFYLRSIELLCES